LRAAVMRIVTDTRQPGVPKDAENSPLSGLYRAFSSPPESAAFCQALQAGLGWGDAKQILYERLERDLSGMREHYGELMAKSTVVEEILVAGAEKARKITLPFIQILRDAVGLRALGVTSATPAVTAHDGQHVPIKPPRLVSFRDKQGGIRFRLLATDGEELLLSVPYTDPKAAGVIMRRVQSEPVLLRLDSMTYVALLDDVPIAYGPESAQLSKSEQGLEKTRVALNRLVGRS
jgi:tryptophanyl-tRNA synthetase